MKTLEHWFLRVADSDVTWIGFNWLRPAKHQCLGYSYILLCSVLAGLVGVAAGGGLIYLVLGRVEPWVCLSLFVFVVILNLPLNMLCAHYWNQRAKKLTPDVPTAA